MTPQAGDPGRGPEVREMFDRIAPTYDLTNRILSMGIDTIWRKRTVRALGPLDATSLDLCAGTLEMTLELLAAGSPRVVAVDFSAEMLERGRGRLPEGAPVDVVVGDAEALSVEGPFGAATCGFGLRNVPDNRAALSEVLSVLRPGGRFAVLEFFRPVRAHARAFHGLFNKLVLPNVGGLISGDRAAYAYLAESMVAYLSRAEFEALAIEVGFELVSSDDLLPPVASLVVLRRPA